MRWTSESPRRFASCIARSVHAIASLTYSPCRSTSCGALSYNIHQSPLPFPHAAYPQKHAPCCSLRASVSLKTRTKDAYTDLGRSTRSPPCSASPSRPCAACPPPRAAWHARRRRPRTPCGSRRTHAPWHRRPRSRASAGTCSVHSADLPGSDPTRTYTSPSQPSNRTNRRGGKTHHARPVRTRARVVRLVLLLLRRLMLRLRLRDRVLLVRA